MPDLPLPGKRRLLANLLIVAGLLLLGWPAAVWLYGAMEQDRLEKEFDRQQSAIPVSMNTSEATPTPTASPSATLSALSSQKNKPSQKPSVRNKTSVAQRSSLSFGQQYRPVSTGSYTPGSALARLRIPKIDLEAIVIEGTNTTDLRRGPGHISGTPLPGEPGNAAIAAHRSRWFQRLPELHKGDPIWVETAGLVYKYVVQEKKTVAPDRGDLLNRGFDPELTLVTCDTPSYHAPYRILVFCHLAATYLADHNP